MKTRFTTLARVQHFTPAAVRQKIRDETERRIDHCAVHPDRITERLGELDREWDVDRALFAWAGSVGLLGLGLGAFVRRGFLALPALVSGLLVSYALTGFCPPAVVMRRRRIRTAGEIASERYALKALRGDFADVQPSTSPETDLAQEGRGARAYMAAAE